MTTEQTQRLPANMFPLFAERFTEAQRKSTRNEIARNVIVVLGAGVALTAFAAATLAAGAVTMGTALILGVISIQTNKSYRYWQRHVEDIRSLPLESKRAFVRHLKDQTTERGVTKRLDKIDRICRESMRRSAALIAFAGGAVVAALIGGEIVVPILAGIVVASEGVTLYGQRSGLRKFREQREDAKGQLDKLVGLANQSERAMGDVPITLVEKMAGAAPVGDTANTSRDDVRTETDKQTNNARPATTPGNTRSAMDVNAGRQPDCSAVPDPADEAEQASTRQPDAADTAPRRRGPRP